MPAAALGVFVLLGSAPPAAGQVPYSIRLDAAPPRPQQVREPTAVGTAEPPPEVSIALDAGCVRVHPSLPEFLSTATIQVVFALAGASSTGSSPASIGAEGVGDLSFDATATISTLTDSGFTAVYRRAEPSSLCHFVLQTPPGGLPSIYVWADTDIEPVETASLSATFQSLPEPPEPPEPPDGEPPVPSDTLTAEPWSYLVSVLDAPSHSSFDPNAIDLDLSQRDPDGVDLVVLEQSDHRPVSLILHRPDSGTDATYLPPLCYLVRLVAQSANVPGTSVGAGGSDAYFPGPGGIDPVSGVLDLRVDFPPNQSSPRRNDVFIAADDISEPDEAFLIEVWQVGPPPAYPLPADCALLPDSAVTEQVYRRRILIRDPGFGVGVTVLFAPDPAQERAFAAPVQITAIREFDDEDLLVPDACYRVTLASYTATAPGDAGAALPGVPPDIMFDGPGSGAGGATFDVSFTGGVRTLRYPDRLFVLADTAVEGPEVVHVWVRRCEDETTDPILADRYELRIEDDDTPFDLTFELAAPATGDRVAETNQDQLIQFVLTREPTAAGVSDLAFPPRCYRIELDLYSAATVPGVTEVDRYPVDVAFQPAGVVRTPPTTGQSFATGTAVFEVTFLINESHLLINRLFLFGDRRPEIEEWFRLRFYEGSETCEFPAGLRFPILTEIVYIDDDDAAQETIPPLVVAFSRIVAASMAASLADRADCSLTGRCATGVVPPGVIPPWLLRDGDRSPAAGLVSMLSGFAGLGSARAPPSLPGARPPGWVGDHAARTAQLPLSTLATSLLPSLPNRWMVQPRQLPGGAPIDAQQAAWTFWGGLDRRRSGIQHNATQLSVTPAVTLLTAGADRAFGGVLLGGFYSLAAGEGRAVLFNAQHERVWKSHQFGPYVIVPFGTRVRIWAGGYLSRARMDQRAYPDPERVLGIPADLRGTVAIGGAKIVLLRGRRFDFGFTADLFQGQIGRAYPDSPADDEDLPLDQRGQLTGAGTADDARDRLTPQRRPLEALPFGRQRLAAVLGFQVERGRLSELRLAVELAGRRDTGIDRPGADWPLPVDPGAPRPLVGGDIALRVSFSDAVRRLALSAAYLVQVFHQSGYDAAARSFSASLRYGRVGPTSGPWLAVAPTRGVSGLQARSWWDSAFPGGPEGLDYGWSLPLTAGYRFAPNRDVSVSVAPPVTALGPATPVEAAWLAPRWSVGVTARIGLP